jgi:hypothetical protein
MTTARTIRNRETGETALPSSHLSGVFRSWRCGRFNFFGSRRVVLRGLPESSRILPYLVGESDDFESRNRLNWWSYGAFASKGQLHGNQYLAGRRAPPLLHQK